MVCGLLVGANSSRSVKIALRNGEITSFGRLFCHVADFLKVWDRKYPRSAGVGLEYCKSGFVWIGIDFDYFFISSFQRLYDVG